MWLELLADCGKRQRLVEDGLGNELDPGGGRRLRFEVIRK